MPLPPGIYVIEGDCRVRQLGQTLWGSTPPPHGVNAVYVDYRRGDDANAGTTPDAPLKTRKAAFGLWRRLTS